MKLRIMKKEYINPELQVVLLNMQQHLLAGSVGEDIVGDTVADGDTQLSRLIDESSTKRANGTQRVISNP